MTYSHTIDCAFPDCKLPDNVIIVMDKCCEHIDHFGTRSLLEKAGDILVIVGHILSGKGGGS